MGLTSFSVHAFHLIQVTFGAGIKTTVSPEVNNGETVTLHATLFILASLVFLVVCLQDVLCLFFCSKNNI